MKKFVVIFLLLNMLLCSGYKKLNKYVIAPEKDAYVHNERGLLYLKDRIYYAAIQEFKIAISLAPNTQATAIYKNNLGETYMFIGYPDEARTCFEEALNTYGLNFQYYLNLINCYQQLGILKSKIREYKYSQNPYDRIKLGLIYITIGETRHGVNVLDEFCMSEPDLMITPAIRQYLKEVNSKL